MSSARLALLACQMSVFRPQSYTAREVSGHYPVSDGLRHASSGQSPNRVGELLSVSRSWTKGGTVRGQVLEKDFRAALTSNGSSGTLLSGLDLLMNILFGWRRSPLLLLDGCFNYLGPPQVSLRFVPILSLKPCEAGYLLLFLVSVYKLFLDIGECIYLVSFRGYRKHTPYFM